MNAFEVISRHYEVGSIAHHILLVHSVLVGRKAMEIADAYEERHRDRTVDRVFLEEISLLHDIGIIRCDAPEIGCQGDSPYICHGILGREMLESEGLPKHALACERHTGSGISASEVAERELPLPPRDYLPETVEEKILCVADKFYGKTPSKLWSEKPLEHIEHQMAKYGESVARRWTELWSEICG